MNDSPINDCSEANYALKAILSASWFFFIITLFAILGFVIRSRVVRSRRRPYRPNVIDLSFRRFKKYSTLDEDEEEEECTDNDTLFLKPPTNNISSSSCNVDKNDETLDFSSSINNEQKPATISHTMIS